MAYSICQSSRAPIQLKSSTELPSMTVHVIIMRPKEKEQSYLQIFGGQ